MLAMDAAMSSVRKERHLHMGSEMEKRFPANCRDMGVEG